MAESSSMSPRPGSKMLGSDHSSTASPLPYTEVVVVRHGETEWNVNGRLQGHLDVLLNDTGRQQAAAVANRLSKEPKIAAIYSSDLKRALTTAEIIAASCGGLEVVEDGDLRERHLGQLQGLVLRDTAKVNPEAYQAFLSRRTSQDIPSQRSKCKMEANNSLMPLFNGSDYAFWKFKMEKFLDSESINLWHCIRKGWSLPMKEVDGVQIEKSRDDWNRNEEALYLKNNECMIMLATSLSRDEGGKIAHCKSAREIWTTLEIHHEGTSHVKAIKKELLIREYELFKHKIGENVMEMTNRLLQIVRTLRNYDKICSRKDINYKILYSLPKISFEARVTAIIEVHDLSKLNTDELIGKLIAHEMTYGKELLKEWKKCLALKARVESSSSEDGSIETDRHCLQKHNQVFQRNKDRRNCTILQKCSKRDENEMKCYECGRKGHMRSECPKLEESPSKWHKKDKGVEAKRKGYTATWSDYFCDEEDVENKNGKPIYCLRATID